MSDKRYSNWLTIRVMWVVVILLVIAIAILRLWLGDWDVRCAFAGDPALCAATIRS